MIEPPATTQPAPHFQEVILRLHHFWQQHGCALMQPQDCEVGAGTFHPATFLRAIGPEPWRAAYVQPSRRPQDGRYGKNPNRLQHYYQFQVVIKPSPDNFQQLYLESLAALGLRAAAHDIRFVEDDWESPTLGAWGLGWEVWIDGMEASQFTYFQEVGGLPAKPVTGEITYGLERLSMFLQNRDNVFDLQWTDALTYRDMHLQSEEEHSVYNFERADTAMLARHFDECEKAATDLLTHPKSAAEKTIGGKNGKKECARDGESTALVSTKQLPLPAYELTMKCSHLFNLLDARGAISVTERARYVARVRNLSRAVAAAYLQTRREMNPPFPLCRDNKNYRRADDVHLQAALQTPATRAS